MPCLCSNKCPYFPFLSEDQQRRVRTESRKHRFLRILWIDVGEFFRRHVALF